MIYKAPADVYKESGHVNDLLCKLTCLLTFIIFRVLTKETNRIDGAVFFTG